MYIRISLSNYNNCIQDGKYTDTCDRIKAKSKSQCNVHFNNMYTKRHKSNGKNDALME